MNKEKKILLVILLILVGLIASFTSYMLITDKSKRDNKIKVEQNYSNLNNEFTYIELDSLFTLVNNQKNSATIIKEITDSLKYINIILEDVPKADTVDDYYRANNYAISELYSLTSQKEFRTFYDKIAPLQKFKQCEILTDTIKNTAYEYSVQVKLIGNEEIVIPVIIFIQDAEKLESTSYWNKE